MKFMTDIYPRAFTGAYSCVGKSLALMELRYVIHRIVMDFNVAFAPGEDGRRVIEEAKDTFTLSPGELDLVFSIS